MRKHLLPSFLILLLGLGLAYAQTINKALQLSQSPGRFGVDTNNNVYFPAHILSQGPGTPTVAAAAGTVTISGTDTAGTVTGGGTSTTTVTVTFNKAFGAAPTCVMTVQNPATSPLAYNAVATGINITGSMGAAIANYICTGKS